MSVRHEKASVHHDSDFDNAAAAFILSDVMPHHFSCEFSASNLWAVAAVNDNDADYDDALITIDLTVLW